MRTPRMTGRGFSAPPLLYALLAAMAGLFVAQAGTPVAEAADISTTTRLCVRPSGTNCNPNTESGSDVATVTGQNYTVFWTVSPTPPVGTVTVRVDGTTVCGPSAAAASGSCTVSASNFKLAADSPYSVEVQYTGGTSGSDTYLNSSASMNHVVNKAATTTQITNAASLTSDSTAVGQAYNVNYSVSVDAPGSGTPTGNVRVSDGAVTNTCTVAAGTCSLTSTSVGLKKITAQYLGDNNFNGSTSAEVDHTVSKGTTTTTITNAASLQNTPSVVGQPVTVQWSVSPAAATGTVTVDAGPSCTVEESVGQCSLTWISPGEKDIVATYSGDANYFGSASSAVRHTVNKAATTIVITNSSELAGASAANQPHTVKWQVNVVAPGAGTPTGLVDVRVNGIVACTALVETGECTVRSFLPGAWNFTAAYRGDANFNASVSDSVPQNHTSIQITNAAEISQATRVGVPFVVQWQTTPPSGLTGSVNVMVSGDIGCTAPVEDGQCSVTPTSPGPKFIQAVYGGDDNNAGSSSQFVFKWVNGKAPTSIRITNQDELRTSSPVGQPYTVKWTVTGGNPDVQVRVMGDGGGCSAPAAVGECQITPATAGFKILWAQYEGDALTAPSTSNFVFHRVTAP